MRDAISLQRAQLLHPKIRQEVIDIINDIETDSFPITMSIRIVQGLRTIEEQNALYAQGRTVKGNIVTNAKGGSSFHNYGLAIDFAIVHDTDNNGTYNELSWDINLDYDHDGVKDWQEVVEVFKQHGYEWGGNWTSIKDYPHVQKSFGQTWRQLYQKYIDKNFIPTTQYINI